MNAPKIGIVRSVRTSILALLVLATAVIPLGVQAEAKPVQMEKFVVQDKHLLCFGVALSLWEDKNTGRVLAMYVKAVAPDSMAGEKGLRPGTRIWSVDGVAVESFEATFSAGSELGNKFLDRKRGEVIVLEIKNEGERSRFVSLTQSPLRITVREIPPTK
jgi:membrane-associated protease RseP (regulator of RpoE activity)